jgi:4-amino-4-deoxy-L-arabinose transferase-like glycosyltransferase
MKISWLKDTLIITLFTAILFGSMLGSYPLECPDGARYAEIPREMLVTGDFITPHLNGLKYFEKPPLFYWLQAASLKAFGINEFGAGLPNALIGIFCCLATYLGARKIFGRGAALLSSFILATCTIFFVLTQIATLDLTFTLFLTSAMLTFLIGINTPPGNKSRKYYLFSTYILSAFAILTKGLIGAIFPILIIFFYVVLTNDWRNLKNYYIPSGIVLFLCIALPWHILVQIKNPEFFHFYFIEQHFLRYITVYAERTQPWWFLPTTLLGGFYPWMFFLFPVIIHNLSFRWQERMLHKNQMFFLIWPICIYIFYTFSSSKLVPYLLPTLSPLAILTGKYFADHWQSNRNKAISIGVILFTVTFFFLGITAFFAPNFSTFQQQHVNAILFYRIGLLAICGALLTSLVYFRGSIRAGVIALIISTGVLFISVKPLIPLANHQSIKPLITLLQTHLQPGDEVVSFQTYYHDLPFYLNRIVTMVDYQGELKFGIQHTKNTENWVINKQIFTKRWLGNKKMFMITNTGNYMTLKNQNLPMYLIANYLDNVLVTNKQ